MKKLLRYSFTLLLLLSCVIVVPFTFFRDRLSTQASSSASTTVQFVPSTRPRTETTATTATTNTMTEATTPSDTVSTTAPTTAPTLSQTLEGAFADTLFIGDSRTYGFLSYNISVPGATFFCAEGMSSLNVLKKTIPVAGYGEITLEQLLQQKQFKQVYMMFGLNEIGSNIDAIAVKYQQIIGAIATAQPDAKVIVQSTIHVTESVSDKNIRTGEVYNNERIDRLNRLLEQLVDEPYVYYLDVNAAFDTAGHALQTTYSAGDGMHFNVRGYIVWRDFLFESRIL